jgi:hypothetical protein
MSCGPSAYNFTNQPKPNTPNSAERLSEVAQKIINSIHFLAFLVLKLNNNNAAAYITEVEMAIPFIPKTGVKMAKAASLTNRLEPATRAIAWYRPWLDSNETSTIAAK